MNNIASNIYNIYLLLMSFFILGAFSIPIDFFKMTAENLIDYSTFDGYKISLIITTIESEVFSYTILPFIRENKTKLRVIAKNHANIAANSLEYQNVAYKQGKQPNMVLRIQLSLETQNNKLFFLDSKLINDPVKVLSLTRGHLSQSTSLNITELITRAQKVTKEELKILEDYSLNLKSFLKNKVATPEKSYAFYIEIIKDIYLNTKVRSIVPSIIQKPIIIPKDNFFVSLTENDYLCMFDILKQELLQENTFRKLIIVNNRDNDVHEDFWHNTLLKIMKKYPEGTKQKFLNNYHKFKLLEHDLDIQ